MPLMAVELLRCPHGVMGISIAGDRENGSTRVTSYKCCGTWSVTRRWAVDASRLNDAIAKESERAKERMKRL